MSNHISQNQKILGFMRLNGSITPAKALKHYGVMRLGARIHELKRKGYNITSKLIRTKAGNHIAEYTLERTGS